MHFRVLGLDDLRLFRSLSAIRLLSRLKTLFRLDVDHLGLRCAADPLDRCHRPLKVIRRLRNRSLNGLRCFFPLAIELIGDLDRRNFLQTNKFTNTLRHLSPGCVACHLRLGNAQLLADRNGRFLCGDTSGDEVSEFGCRKRVALDVFNHLQVAELGVVGVCLKQHSLDRAGFEQL